MGEQQTGDLPKSLRGQRRGATLSGYGLVVGLIAVVALGALGGIGDQVQNLFGDVADELDGVSQFTPSASPGSSAAPSASASASASGSPADIELVMQSGAIRFSDGTEPATCKGYLADEVAPDYPSVPGNNSSDDGVYWIDPTGAQPIKAYCDMGTDSGGWTLVTRDDNTSSYNGDNDPGFYYADYPGNIVGYRMADTHYAALVTASAYGRHFYEGHSAGTRRYWAKSQMSGFNDQTQLLYNYCSSCGDKRWSMFQTGSTGFAGYDRTWSDSAYENMAQQGAWSTSTDAPTGSSSNLRYWNYNSGIATPYNLNLTIWLR